MVDFGKIHEGDLLKDEQGNIYEYFISNGIGMMRASIDWEVPATAFDENELVLYWSEK